MWISKVHCFEFLGCFAILSGIISFAAYDSLYSYIMKLVGKFDFHCICVVGSLVHFSIIMFIKLYLSRTFSIQLLSS